VWFMAGLFPVYPVTIMSGSMEPLAYPGDVVIIEKADASKMQANDIVQYWNGDVFVIHRLINIYEEDGRTVYITKGDNNNVRDSQPVTAEQIKGKVIATIPKLGLLTFWLRS
jgi:signal peptidase